MVVQEILGRQAARLRFMALIRTRFCLLIPAVVLALRRTAVAQLVRLAVLSRPPLGPMPDSLAAHRIQGHSPALLGLAAQRALGLLPRPASLPAVVEVAALPQAVQLLPVEPLQRHSAYRMPEAVLLAVV